MLEVTHINLKFIKLLYFQPASNGIFFLIFSASGIIKPIVTSRLYIKKYKKISQIELLDIRILLSLAEKIILQFWNFYCPFKGYADNLAIHLLPHCKCRTFSNLNAATFKCLFMQIVLKCVIIKPTLASRKLTTNQWIFIIH